MGRNEADGCRLSRHDRLGGSKPSFDFADWLIVNASNNRLSSFDGYQFDAAGNTTRDPQNRKFTYDAENKQTKVESVNSSGTVTGIIGEYFY